MTRKTILCFASYFLPGFKSGGPVRSLTNLCDWLGDEFRVCIVTRNRDIGSELAYADLAPGRWYSCHGAEVQYLAPPYWRPGPIRELLRDIQPDLLYLNSALDPSLGILPLVYRRIGLLRDEPPILIAPRGEFSPGALALKPRKKGAYLRLAKWLRLYENVVWQATSEPEAGHLSAWWGRHARIELAPNLPPRAFADSVSHRNPKQPGLLRMAFLSRISPKKNLDGALTILTGIAAHVHFDIYGTKEDADHWEDCREIMAKLPANVTATYKGVLAPDDVVRTLSGYDLLFFPTLGENFGHVILEALLAGCPVLLSDQTPWRNLAAVHAGCDIALQDANAFRRFLEMFAALGNAEFEVWSRGARELGLRYCASGDVIGPTRRMFEAAMGS